MANRYGVLPSDIIKTSAGDYQLNLLVASTAIAEETKVRDKIKEERALKNATRRG